MGRWRLYVLAAIAAFAVIAGADWASAQARLSDVHIDVALDPHEVVADGQSSTVVTMCVTDRRGPRAGALLQLWIQSGSGLLVPEWVITDENGCAQSRYTPNPSSPYDPSDTALIYVMDTTLGRIIEVDSRQLIQIPLAPPG
ncbi:MAG: hypothetical protein GX620_17070 [Chloroflexi bacterium]|nr:hypothetical protein [Chloroflexota bacterium]